MMSDAPYAEDEYGDHPAFGRVVELLVIARSDDCTPLGEVAAHIIHAIERPGTPIAALVGSSQEAADQ